MGLLDVISIVKKNRLGSKQIQFKVPLLKKIKKVVNENKQVYILLFDLSDLYFVNDINLKSRPINMQRLLLQNTRLYLLPSEIINLQKLSEEMFILYVSHSEPFDLYELQIKLSNLKESLKSKIKRSLGVKSDILINIGCSSITANNLTDLEKSLFNSIKQAFQSLSQEIDWEKEKLTRELVTIISNEDFNSLYQPLVSLKHAKIFGYEALTRGPAESFFYSPDNIFPFAEENGLSLHLEMVTRKLAIKRFTIANSDIKLFLNLSPQILDSPSFVPGETLRFIKEYNLLPQNIVFEITERNAIQDFANFKKSILHYRDQGFMVAVDDAGAGYSSLQSIAEIKPDFIKIDKSLVCNVDKDMVKKALMETFVSFANKINSRIIAEGIETEDELRTLLSMGVAFGQGFFLARPGNPLPAIENKALITLQNLYPSQRNHIKYPYMQLEDIVYDCLCVKKETLTKEIVNYFIQNEHAKSVVVIENSQPIGLIMRDKLFQKISVQYGVALYWEKPVSLVMDANPLIVEAYQPLVVVSELAANRNSKKLYDNILIAKDHVFIGTVSVQKLINSIHKEKPASTI